MQCISASALTARVELVLGRRLRDGSSAPSSLILDVTETPGGFVATLTLVASDGDVIGVRVIEQVGASCRVLDGALVVVSAMLADLREPESRLDLREEPPTEPHVEPQEDEVEVGLWLAADAAWSLLPGFSGGAAIGLWIRPPGFWPMELTASVHPEAGTGTNLGATFLSFIGSFSVCAPVDAPSWQLRICGGASAGLTRGLGRGFESNQEQLRPYVDVRAVAELEILVADPLHALLRFGAAVPLLRTEFVGRAGGEEFVLHAYGYVVPFGNVGLGVHF